RRHDRDLRNTSALRQFSDRGALADCAMGANHSSASPRAAAITIRARRTPCTIAIDGVSWNQPTTAGSFHDISNHFGEDLTRPSFTATMCESARADRCFFVLNTECGHV